MFQRCRWMTVTRKRYWGSPSNSRLPMPPSKLMIARDDWAIKVWIDVDCFSLLPAFFEADDDDAMFAMLSSYNGVWYDIALPNLKNVAAECRVRMRVEEFSCCGSTMSVEVTFGVGEMSSRQNCEGFQHKNSRYLLYVRIEIHDNNTPRARAAPLRCVITVSGKPPLLYARIPGIRIWYRNPLHS